MNTPHAQVDRSPEDKAKPQEEVMVPLSDLEYGDRTDDVLGQYDDRGNDREHPLMHNRHVYGTEDKDGRLVGEGKLSGGAVITEAESNERLNDRDLYKTDNRDTSNRGTSSESTTSKSPTPTSKKTTKTDSAGN